MNTVKKCIIGLGLFLVSFSVYAEATEQEIKDYMMADLDIIEKAFEVKYAPAEWKRSYTNWDLKDQIRLAKDKIYRTPDITLKDYQRIVLSFIKSTRDYHVGVYFYSTESAFLPFRVHGAKGKYFVAWAPPYHALKKGDEILTFGGRPVEDVIQELKVDSFCDPLSGTDQALTEYHLTSRLGMKGDIVPSGEVEVTVRCAESDQLETYYLEWDYFPEEIHTSLQKFIPKQPFFGHQRPLGKCSFFHKDMTLPFYTKYKEHLKKYPIACEQDNFLGSRKSFVPPLGDILWESDHDAYFYAYIFRSPEGKRVGYVRIPHYDGDVDQVKEFSEIILFFEKNTDALVIDQVHNPGGSAFYLYALASTLSDTPLDVPTHSMAITQEDVFFALLEKDEFAEVENDEDAVEVLGETLGGYPVDYDLTKGVLNYLQYIIDEWNDGRNVTHQEYLYGIDRLKPYPDGQYTKSILVLINELDFSCGDFFPAILQDNQRVTLLGTGTAGAGGYVLWQEYPNLLGVAGFSCTGSLAERVDSNPIENLGVQPDIVVELTERDLKEGYPDYKAEIHKALRKL